MKMGAEKETLEGDLYLFSPLFILSVTIGSIFFDAHKKFFGSV
jgi:hypothetical protein